MGLCFGGGQLGIGLAGFALGFVTLTLLRKPENRLPRHHYGVLEIAVSPDGPNAADLTALLNSGGVSVKEPTLCVDGARSVKRIYGWKVDWKGKHQDKNLPNVIYELRDVAGVEELKLTRGD
jgi:putative Mg2+ transporter-C (MgtC) family protein